MPHKRKVGGVQEPYKHKYLEYHKKQYTFYIEHDLNDVFTSHVDNRTKYVDKALRRQMCADGYLSEEANKIFIKEYEGKKVYACPHCYNPWCYQMVKYHQKFCHECGGKLEWNGIEGVYIP